MDLSFGTRLRTQRERQQLTLAAIAGETKIKLSLLDALEHDDVSHWPANIYGRAYVRAYARAIGLDADLVLREFLELHPEPAELSPDAIAAALNAAADSAGVSSGGRLRRLVSSAIAAVPAFLQTGQRPGPVTSQGMLALDLGNTPVPVAAPRRMTSAAGEPEPTGRGVAPGVLDAPTVGHSSAAAGAADTATGTQIPDVASVPKRDPGLPASHTDGIAGEDHSPERAHSSGASVDPPDSRVETVAPIAGGPEPDLSAAALLCTRLGQAISTREVAPILEQVVAILDATGAMLWAWDPNSASLKPCVAHGFSDATLAKFPGVRTGDDNAIAAAFRAADTCVVDGDAGLMGAIAVPVMAAGGCVGVFALELRDGGEQREPVRAFARILAAQLLPFIQVPRMAAHDEPVRDGTSGHA